MTRPVIIPERFVVIVLIVVGLLSLVACSDTETKELDIPEGFATTTLKEFARQADVEIIFDSRSVYGVKTHAVRGSHNPGDALRIMLEDTPLRVDFDEASGAYAVKRVEFSVIVSPRDHFLFHQGGLLAIHGLEFLSVLNPNV
jgi:hypothetical protein